MATTAFTVVLKEIEDHRESIARALIDGTAKDFADYRDMCGQIRGLSTAHMYITDLVRKMEQNDDE
jgi:Mg2+ and Co2+ transporter CorA